MAGLRALADLSVAWAVLARLLHAVLHLLLQWCLQQAPLGLCAAAVKHLVLAAVVVVGLGGYLLVMVYTGKQQEAVRASRACAGLCTQVVASSSTRLLATYLSTFALHVRSHHVWLQA